MEGSKVQGTFQEINLVLSEKLSEFCGPRILRGYVTLGLVRSPMSYLTYEISNFPLVVVSSSVL